MVVAQLIFEMAANVARLQSDMAKANNVVTGTMQDIKGAAAIATKALGAVGIALGVREFADMVKASAEATDHLRTLSIQTGITVETLSALKSVAKASGTQIDTVAGMVNRLEKNMLSAVNGNDKMIDAFAGLGISSEQLKAGLQDMDSFLPLFAQKLLEAGESGNLSAEAMRFMGRSGAQALPFLEQLAAAGELHAKVTSEQAEQAHQFIVQLRLMEGRSASLKREFTTGLVPALNSVLGAFSDSAVAAEDARGAGEAFGTMIRWAAQILYGFWSTLNLVGKGLAVLAGTMSEIARGNFRQALAYFNEGMQDISKTAGEAADRIRKMGEEANKLPDVRRKGSGRTRSGAPTGDTDSTEGAGEADGNSFAPQGFAAGGFGVIASQVRGLNSVLRDTRDIGADVGGVLEQAGIRGVRSMSGLQDVLRNVLAQLAQMAIRNIGNSIGGAVSNGIGGAIGSGLGNIFSGASFAPQGAAAGAAPAAVTIEGDRGASVNVTNNFTIHAGSGAGSADVQRLVAMLPNLIAQHSIVAIENYLYARGRTLRPA